MPCPANTATKDGWITKEPTAPLDAKFADDDPMGTRDWEGPIPAVTPRTRPQPLARRSPVRALVRSAMALVRREMRVRPFVVLGATLGVGVLAGVAVRSTMGRALLLSVAKGLTDQVRS